MSETRRENINGHGLLSGDFLFFLGVKNGFWGVSFFFEICGQLKMSSFFLNKKNEWCDESWRWNTIWNVFLFSGVPGATRILLLQSYFDGFNNSGFSPLPLPITNAPIFSPFPLLSSAN